MHDKKFRAKFHSGKQSKNFESKTPPNFTLSQTPIDDFY